jgi:hypothetical protein
MHPYLTQSLETLRALDALQTIGTDEKRSLIISAARTIHQLHQQLDLSIMPADDPQPGNIVYDLAELATLLDQGVPDQIVASGLREAATIIARLCDILTSSGLLG